MRLLTRKFIHWNIDSKQKVLYYTFDDGPIPELTPKVLEILRKYDAKATFFMVGDNVQKYPEIMEAVQKEGHVVGNHSFNHIKGWKVKNDVYFANIAKAKAIIPSSLFRPPYGQITLSQIKKLSKEYEIIMWTVLSGDFDSKTSPKQCKDNIVDNAKCGSIIVMHDNLKAEKNMLYALEESLRIFKEKGYEFKSLQHLL